MSNLTTAAITNKNHKGKLKEAYALLNRQSTQALFANSNKVSMFDINDGIKIFHMLDIDNSLSLSHDEVVEGCGSILEVVEIIDKYDGTALSMLKNKSEVRSILWQIDADGDRKIDFSEWEEFLGMIILTDIKFLKIKAFNTGRCFFGKGLDDGQVDGKFIKRGWLEDFWFYQSNNHFLLMLCFRDPVHPLRTSSIINIEYVCQAFNLVLIVLCAFIDAQSYCDSDDDEVKCNYRFPPFYLTIFIATIPVICIRKFLLVSYKCPCCEDRKLSHQDVTTCCTSLASHLVGFTFWCVATILVIIFSIIAANMSAEVGYGFLASWGQSYVYAIFTDIAVTFNSAEWAVKIVDVPVIGALATAMGLGMWQRERNTIRNSEKHEEFKKMLAGVDISALEAEAAASVALSGVQMTQMPLAAAPVPPPAAYAAYAAAPVPPPAAYAAAQVPCAAAPAPFTGWLQVKEGGTFSTHHKVWCVAKDGQFNCFGVPSEGADLGFDLKFGFSLKGGQVKELSSKALEVHVVDHSHALHLELNNPADKLEPWQAALHYHIAFASQ